MSKISDLNRRQFHKQIFLGGPTTKEQVALLHKRLDDALSTLSGMQQNGLQGSNFDIKEVFEGQEIIKSVIEDIIAALL